MANTRLVERFGRAIERAFSRSMDRIEARHDFHAYQHVFRAEYEAAIGIIVAVRDAGTLAALMDRYLALYFRYHANTNNVHYYRSDQTFSELFDRSTRVPAGTRDLFAEWAAFLNGKAKTDAAKRFKQRFDELGRLYQSAVTKTVVDETQRRRTTRSILDTLKDEYLRQHGRAPRTHDDLYAFDPSPSETLKIGLTVRLSGIRSLWIVCTAQNTPAKVQALNQSLDAFRTYLASVSRDGALPLFQIIKWLQDRMRTKRVPMTSGIGTRLIDGDQSELGYELYAMACFQLLVFASGTMLLEHNRYGFTREERVYFLKPIHNNNYPYFSNLEHRFRARLEAVAALFEPTKTFLNLILVARNQLSGATLVDWDKTFVMQQEWTEVTELVRSMKGLSDVEQMKVLAEPGNWKTLTTLVQMAATSVEVRSGPELGKGIARVGSSPGEHPVFGTITIIHIDPRSYQIYVEFAGLKPNLFRVTHGYIADKLYASRILGIYRSTVGMVYVTQAILLMMGFAPVLIEEGFAGLIYEVVIYFSSTQLDKLASRVDPRLGKVLGLLFQLLAPRPNFKPELSMGPVDPPLHVGDLPVRVLSPETTGPTRGFAEILTENREATKLITDLNKGTLKGAAAQAADAFRDQIAKVVDALPEFPSLSPGRSGLLDSALAGAGASSGTTTSLLGEESAQLGAAREGSMFRTRGQEARRTAGGSSRGTRRGVEVTSRKEALLRGSRDYQLLEQYLDILETHDALVARNDMRTIMKELATGTTYSRAAKEIRNILNAAKESTGEYVADGVVFSNFKVLKVFSAFSRSENVPILDRVYQVRDYETGQVDFLLVEVKGGNRTKLGVVTKKRFDARQEKLVPVTPRQWVRQASGEWYYQRFIEMYKSAPRTSAGSAQRAAARELFEAGRKGRLQTAIIKSGRELDPKITFNTDEVTGYLQGAEWPFD